MNEYKKAIEILEKYNQKNVIEQLKKYKSEELIKQVLSIDFEKINKILKENKKEETEKAQKKIIEKIDCIEPEKIKKEEIEKYNKIGEKLVREGKYAVVTMAGGQGTRLGHNGPKGTYLINIKPEPKYLFQIIAEKLIEKNNEYNIIIPWYIMTSRENNEETINFFIKNNYFSYPKEYIMFFTQGEMPLIGKDDGEVLINEKGIIEFASDGNGSIYKSLKEKLILEDMKKRNIEWVYISSIDNILLKLIEPLLLGITISQKNEIASKTIEKINPEERVGVFCKKNKKPYVIEYTELPIDMAKLRDKEEKLVYGEAHIMCNLFSLKAIEKIATKELPYHIAIKKAKYYKNGKIIEPKEPNAYKLESFIFDGFKYFDNITLLRGKREEDFAPVKNKEGIDSPETAIKLYNLEKTN